MSSIPLYPLLGCLHKQCGFRGGPWGAAEWIAGGAGGAEHGQGDRGEGYGGARCVDLE